MKFFKVLMFALSMFFTHGVIAHDSTMVINPRMIGIKGHYGYIIPYHKDKKEVSASAPTGFQLEYMHHLNTQDVWNRLGYYPRVGISFSYVDYSNSLVLGNSYSLCAFFEPFLTVDRKFNQSFRLGFGASYLDKPYHSVSNPENMFFSSPISLFIQLNTAINYSVSEYIDLSLSANFSHISNGSIKKPNRGINFPTLAMGLNYKLNKTEFVKRNRLLSKEEIHGKLWRVYTGISTSFKSDYHGNEFQVHGLEIMVGRIVSRVSALNIGVDISHDRSLITPVFYSEDIQYRPTFVSAILTHELLLGRFYLDQSFGVYCTKPTSETFPVYQKIGFGFIPIRNISLGITLKAHKISAEYLGVKLGVRM